MRNALLPALSGAVLLAAAVGALAACESPDPVSRMDDFADRTGSVPVAAADAGTADIGDFGCDPPDPTGTWFFALSANIDREAPLYFEIDITLNDDCTISTIGQPLRYDADPEGVPSDAPRTAVGDAVAASSDYGADGSFMLTYPDVLVTGEANPLTGREIEGTVILNGRLLSEDIAAGDMSGDIVAPLVLSLQGSTFAAVRSAPEDYPSIDPVYYTDEIPHTPWSCDEGSGAN